MFQKDRSTVTALELDDLLQTRQSYSTARAEAETQSEPLSHDFTSTTKRRPGPISWQMVGICVGLFITTVLSVLLLIASCSGWTVPDNIYWFNIAHRASIQLVVQIVSNALALVYSSALCTLINYASRMYWDRNGPVRMDMLRFWRDMCALRMDFDIPVSLMALLVGFIGLTSVQSALWAGALTPVATTVVRETNVTVPSYHNASLIAEYASEVGDADAPPDVRGTKGFFTYKVGVGLTGELLRAAASATPTGDEPRKHQKNDNTQFTYIGRSYGVGSSVGLLDDTTPSDTLALGLTYQEVGYDASVSCAYNASTGFVLEKLGSGYIDAFAARGVLPNSAPGDPEYSTYVGWGARSVVAIGVGRDANSARHTLGIAAGEAYAHLNAAQCDISFAPALFDVTVSLTGRNITVTRAGSTNNNSSDAAAAQPALDWDTGSLRYVLTRQFELIANAQTNLYVSLVGSSFNASIADYVTASGGAGLEEATPPGLASAVAVMTDDMLVAYAQAQLMIGGFAAGAPAVVRRQAMRVGEDAYVYAVFVLNVVVILAVLVECLRTRGWRGLVLFDYMDVEWLAVGGFRGGVIAANGVDGEVDVIDGMNPEEWSRLDVSLEGAAGDSFIRVTKRDKAQE
ncbi:hypothetical protein INS49_007246 [Diaporthe citri]|uniref:uncharacterized protein n=1 Tax=Diaporthe citri TaxID=83186 RepID=UPI001C821B4D|nr:uncharacterized protein INS49_007246 [Diaporthe citri]KAG6365635.1 hypothetical protein INS49_007246 [Diaporthe citri]